MVVCFGESGTAHKEITVVSPGSLSSSIPLREECVCVCVCVCARASCGSLRFGSRETLHAIGDSLLQSAHKTACIS